MIMLQNNIQKLNQVMGKDPIICLAYKKFLISYRNRWKQKSIRFRFSLNNRPTHKICQKDPCKTNNIEREVIKIQVMIGTIWKLCQEWVGLLKTSPHAC